jgi:thiol-disulfide isomerase/thioredoxin
MPSGGALVPAKPADFNARLAAATRPLVVNYWAAWCGPCRNEMPRLVAAYKRYRGTVDFIGVDVQDVTADARKFVQEFGIEFGSLVDSRGEIRNSQKILGLPSTQFFRPGGKLAFVHTGEIHEDQLESKLRELVRVSATASP